MTFHRFAPIFGVSDLAAALAFYARLGFATREYAGGGYGFATRDGVELHLGTVPDGVTPTRSSAYLFVDDSDAVARRGGLPAPRSTRRSTPSGASTKGRWSIPTTTSSGSGRR